MMGEVVRLPPPNQRYGIDNAEEMMTLLRDHLHQTDYNYKYIAQRLDMSVSTLHAVASGRTKWPRQKTLFAMLAFFGLRLMVIRV